MSKQPDFEEAMARLEEIAARLESGKGSLEEAMGLYEEGAKLTAQCCETLRRAEQKIVELSEVGEGEDGDSSGDD